MTALRRTKLYEPKILYGLTATQATWLMITALPGITAYIRLKNIYPTLGVGILTICLSIGILMAFFKGKDNIEKITGYARTKLDTIEEPTTKPSKNTEISLYTIPSTDYGNLSQEKRQKTIQNYQEFLNSQQQPFKIHTYSKPLDLKQHFNTIKQSTADTAWTNEYAKEYQNMFKNSVRWTHDLQTKGKTGHTYDKMTDSTTNNYDGKSSSENSKTQTHYQIWDVKTGKETQLPENTDVIIWKDLGANKYLVRKRAYTHQKYIIKPITKKSKKHIENALNGKTRRPTVKLEIPHYKSITRLTPDHIQIHNNFYRYLQVTPPSNNDPGIMLKILEKTSKKADIMQEYTPLKKNMALESLDRAHKDITLDLAARQQDLKYVPISEINHKKDLEDIVRSIYKDKGKLYLHSMTARIKAKTKQGLDANTKTVKQALASALMTTKQMTLEMQKAHRAFTPGNTTTLHTDEIYLSDGLADLIQNITPEPHIDQKSATATIIGKTPGKNPMPVSIDLLTSKRANGHVVTSGLSGSGKSTLLKTIIARTTRLNPEKVSKIYLIDTLKEYGSIVKQFSGKTVKVNLRSRDTNLNPFQLPRPEDLTNPDEFTLTEKIIRLHKLIQLMIVEESPQQFAKLDDALTEIYAEKGITEDKTTWDRAPPTLQDLLDYLIRSEDSATKNEKKTYQSLIGRIKPFVTGSLSFFNQRSSAPQEPDRIKHYELCIHPDYNDIALCYILESIVQEIRTLPGAKLIVIDEIKPLLSKPQAASLFETIARQGRHYSACFLSSTQFIEDFLKSEAGETILVNADTKVIFHSDDHALQKITKLLKLTPEQKEFILPSKIGRCLLIQSDLRIPTIITPLKSELRHMHTGIHKKGGAETQ